MYLVGLNVVTHERIRTWLMQARAKQEPLTPTFAEIVIFQQCLLVL